MLALLVWLGPEARGLDFSPRGPVVTGLALIELPL